uniref:Uncharacterized protein n=1 Tax=Anguilla anguilla TaxID=7936 RepID=A0A0E9XI25_ANGAN
MGVSVWGSTGLVRPWVSESSPGRPQYPLGFLDVSNKVISLDWCSGSSESRSTARETEPRHYSDPYLTVMPPCEHAQYCSTSCSPSPHPPSSRLQYIPGLGSFCSWRADAF